MSCSRRLSRRFFGRSVIAAGGLAVLPGFMFLEAALAPDAELWPRWQAHDPASPAVVDHAPWQRFLDIYVGTDESGLNRVAYADIADPDKQALAAYIESLRLTQIDRFGRSEQLAYWINLYNALTVKLVVDFYPVDSIRDIVDKIELFEGDVFTRKLIDIDGEPISLNDIEHRILRPIWKDPRLHYAVNCASVGCPNLARRAYTGANAEELLEAGARAYVNSRRGVRFESGGMIVSKIYGWFDEDFGGDEAGVIVHLRSYAEPALAARLAANPAIVGYEYDWRLNLARP